MTRRAKQVERKLFRIEQKGRQTNKFVTSATDKEIRKDDDKTTLRGVVMQNFKYYYNIEDVYNDRVAYRPKATSAGIMATGYVSSVTVTSSVTNTDDSDGEETIGKEVPEDV